MGALNRAAARLQNKMNKSGNTNCDALATAQQNRNIEFSHSLTGAQCCVRWRIHFDVIAFSMISHVKWADERREMILISMVFTNDPHDVETSGKNQLH